MDTIFALASARGRAGVSVLRVSGPRAKDAGRALCGDLPASHQVRVRNLFNGAGELLDQALVVVFEDGRSFTGEDVVELHVHGSRAVVASVLHELGQIEGLRLAEPGEFTRRAMENDRLGLTQVEGLADLIEAETEAQRKQALRVFSGALGEKAERWRAGLVRAAALLAAVIDFSDDDVPEEVTEDVLDILRPVRREMLQELEGSRAAEMIRDGFEVAILGKPNIGKSTLLNSIAGREAAITSAIAGTTRDIIEVRMDLRGLPVLLLDTAGLRETSDIVEALGVERTRERARSANLRVFMLEDLEKTPELFEDGDILIVGKDDFGKFGGVSGKTGFGVDELIDQIATRLEDQASGAGLVIRQRHVQAMNGAADALKLAEEALSDEHDMLEIPAEHLRECILAMDVMIGNVGVEDLLDEIFSTFCLGK